MSKLLSFNLVLQGGFILHKVTNLFSITFVLLILNQLQEINIDVLFIRSLVLLSSGLWKSPRNYLSSYHIWILSFLSDLELVKNIWLSIL